MHITCTGHRFHPGSEYQVASLTDRIPGQVSTGVGALFECLELDLPAAPSVCCNRPSDVCGACWGRVTEDVGVVVIPGGVTVVVSPAAPHTPWVMVFPSMSVRVSIQ